MGLIVTPLSRLAEVIQTRAPSHLITLLSPSDLEAMTVTFEPSRHLRVGVHDVAAPQDGLIAPEAANVEEVLAFAQGWDGAAPMVVHCWAGISRSTASAFAVLCARNPHADELEIALAMRRASPGAFPNRRIVAFADDILDRRGRMLEAVEAMGGNGFIAENVPFELPERW